MLSEADAVHTRAGDDSEWERISDAVGQDAEAVVSVRDVGKCYRLWSRPPDRIRQPVRSMLARWLPIHEKNYFTEFWALSDVSFDVSKGETLGMIGRNGAGKSTLLQIICGTLLPSQGTVRVLGRVSSLLELGTGFNPEFTGRENVYLNAAILGLSRQAIDEKYDDIAGFADIGQFIDQKVKTYSSGMYVRLAFAVAANIDADILVIDEALAVGDAFFVQKCMRFLRSFRERGTLIFTSHDVEAVMTFCDSAMLLENGRIKRHGPSKEVCDLYIKHLLSTEQEDQTHTGQTSGTTRSEVAEDCNQADQGGKDAEGSDFQSGSQPSSGREDAKSFGGQGGAYITDVRLVDAHDGRRLDSVVGGEKVALLVRIFCQKDIRRPVIGFTVRNRLGQVVFSAHSDLVDQSNPPSVPKGSTIQARFTFSMPILSVGDYAVTPVVADGVYVIHGCVFLHWVNDIFVFRSHTKDIFTGVVNIPMDNIAIVTIGEDDPSMNPLKS